MGRRRERREERRGGDAAASPAASPAAAGGPTTYQLRQNMLSIGDDYWIETGHGQKVYKIDGKALRARSTLLFEDAHGKELYKIQQKMLHARETMDIEDGGHGRAVASIKNAMITPVRDRWTVNIPGGEDISIQGNVLDHEYKIERGRRQIAEVSKKWFRVRDSYGVEIQPGNDDALILMLVIGVDMMASSGR